MAGSAGDGRGVARGGFEGVDMGDFGRVLLLLLGVDLLSTIDFLGRFYPGQTLDKAILWWTKS